MLAAGLIALQPCTLTRGIGFFVCVALQPAGGQQGIFSSRVGPERPPGRLCFSFQFFHFPEGTSPCLDLEAAADATANGLLAYYSTAVGIFLIALSFFRVQMTDAHSYHTSF